MPNKQHPHKRSIPAETRKEMRANNVYEAERIG